jgi:predicted ATPase
MIAGCEEPEEALEPLRQTLLARLVRSIAEDDGQVFVVTHSPDIVRAFRLDDLVVLREGTAGVDTRVMRTTAGSNASIS